MKSLESQFNNWFGPQDKYQDELGGILHVLRTDVNFKWQEAADQVAELWQAHTTLVKLLLLQPPLWAHRLLKNNHKGWAAIEPAFPATIPSDVPRAVAEAGAMACHLFNLLSRTPGLEYWTCTPWLHTHYGAIHTIMCGHGVPWFHLVCGALKPHIKNLRGAGSIV